MAGYTLWQTPGLRAGIVEPWPTAIDNRSSGSCALKIDLRPWNGKVKTEAGVVELDELLNELRRALTPTDGSAANPALKRVCQSRNNVSWASITLGTVHDEALTIVVACAESSFWLARTHFIDMLVETEQKWSSLNDMPIVCAFERRRLPEKALVMGIMDVWETAGKTAGAPEEHKEWLKSALCAAHFALCPPPPPPPPRHPHHPATPATPATLATLATYATPATSPPSPPSPPRYPRNPRHPRRQSQHVPTRLFAESPTGRLRPCQPLHRPTRFLHHQPTGRACRAHHQPTRFLHHRTTWPRRKLMFLQEERDQAIDGGQWFWTCKRSPPRR